MATDLDSNQVIQQVYEDATKRLRVAIDAVINMAGQLEVAIDAIDDSIKIGNGSGNFAEVNNDGTIQVAGGLVKEPFDYVGGVHTTTTSTYTYKLGGSGGTLVKTVTVVYTDTTKTEIQSVTAV